MEENRTADETLSDEQRTRIGPFVRLTLSPILGLPAFESVSWLISYVLGPRLLILDDPWDPMRRSSALRELSDTVHAIMTSTNVVVQR